LLRNRKLIHVPRRHLLFTREPTSVKDIQKIVTPPTVLKVATPKPELNPSDALEDQSSTSMLDQTAAWTINTASDLVATSTAVFVGTLFVGKTVAETVLGGVAAVAKIALPETKSEDNLPSVIVGAVEVTKAVGDMGVGVLSDSLSVVSNVGKLAGLTAGDMIKSTAVSVGVISEKNAESSETAKAFHRLGKTGFESYQKVFASVEDTAHGVVEAAKESAVSVISHSLGKDTGKAVKDTVEVGQKIWDSVYTVKTLGTRKIATKFAKAAAKSTVGSVFSKEEEKNQKDNLTL